MSYNYILSICIPTYNRAENLYESISSIVCQPTFQNGQIEVVVCDNCSTDNTQEVCLSFSKKYHNFSYFKNEININDQNFPLVLTKATGLFRKLSNDTIIYNDFTLRYMLEIIQNNKDSQPLIFFTNESKTNTKSRELRTQDIDFFLSDLSFKITWIGGLAVWAQDIENNDLKIEDCELKLWQVSFLISLLRKHNDYVIVKTKLFSQTTVNKKNISYGLYKVFYQNYLNIIMKYVNLKIVKTKTYLFLEKDLLFSFFTTWLINYEINRKLYSYSNNENLKQLIFDTYKNQKYFKKFKIHYYFCLLKSKIKKILKF